MGRLDGHGCRAQAALFPMVLARGARRRAGVVVPPRGAFQAARRIERWANHIGPGLAARVIQAHRLPRKSDRTHVTAGQPHPLSSPKIAIVLRRLIPLPPAPLRHLADSGVGVYDVGDVVVATGQIGVVHVLREESGRGVATADPDQRRGGGGRVFHKDTCAGGRRVLRRDRIHAKGHCRRGPLKHHQNLHARVACGSSDRGPLSLLAVRAPAGSPRTGCRPRWASRPGSSCRC